MTKPNTITHDQLDVDFKIHKLMQTIIHESFNQNIITKQKTVTKTITTKPNTIKKMYISKFKQRLKLSNFQPGYHNIYTAFNVMV